MQIRVQCSCGRAFSVAASQAGQREFCPMCGVQCLVPAVEGGGARKVILAAGGAVVLAAGGFGAWWFFGRTAEDTGVTNGQGESNMRFVEGPGVGTPTGNGGPVSPTPRNPGPRNPTPSPTGLPADVAKRAGELVADLQSGDEYVRARAARDLVELGPEIEPLLQDAAGRGVQWARLVLRAFAWKRELPIEVQVKYAAEIAILNADGDSARRRVIEAWMTARDGGCAPMLSDLIADVSANVRVAALEAAILFRAPVSGAGIVKFVEDPDNEVLGVLAAGLLGVSEAAPRIRPFLADVGMRDLAVATLGLLRDGESSAEIAKDTASPDPQARARAYEALGRIGRFPDGFPIDAIRDPDPDVRQAVFVAAGRCGETSLQNSISQLLADSDPRMRRAGAEALGALGQDTAI
ncbi:MAG: HEAT repeat domain-containing protein, partial [Planctomycetota bacterium]